MNTDAIDAGKLYARKEATTDSVWIEHGPSRPLKRDLVLYRDKARTEEAGRIPWHHAAARARRWVNLNCYRYEIDWTETP